MPGPRALPAPPAGLRGLSLLVLLLGSQAARRPASLADVSSEEKNAPSGSYPLGADELPNNAASKETGAPSHSPAASPVQSGDNSFDSVTDRAMPQPHRGVLPEPAAAPDALTKQTFPSKKKLPSLEQANAARKPPRLQTTPPVLQQAAASQPDLPGLTSFTSAEELDALENGITAATDAKQATHELPLWGGRKGSRGITSQSPLQISPFTLRPLLPQPTSQSLGAVELSVVGTAAGPGGTLSPLANETSSTEGEANGSAAEESQETTTSTIITTTVITTERTPAVCSVSFYDPEGYIDSTDYPPLPVHGFLECTYNVTVYTGYGVELQVKSVNLSEGEVLAIHGVDNSSLVILANQTLLVEGQVIRSPTNTISVYFRTFQDDVVGTFQLHYQVFMLSCSFPRRPDFGDVTVMDLHSGGVAHFHCYLGYELQGPKVLTCLNASRPHWSSPEPVCSAPCGGMVHNATIGRVLSPSYMGNQTNMSCVWTIEAPQGQKLHLHFERLLLSEKDRMVVYSGESDRSAVLYDSLRTESVPFEGVISDGAAIRIDFTAEEARPSTAFNIRFEAFERGHCYEPYIQNGNFTASDPTYNLGTTVEFTCDPGHSLEQGPAVIECVNVRDPYWNDTEPLCRAMCGGELSAAAGVILSPNWPEPYAEGEDCVWRVHVGEEKRLFVDIQLLNLSNSDILTIYDGDELTARILGQYVGSSGPQKLYSSTPDLTIQFHSDPAGLIFGKGQGFIMNYIEVSRNDSCSDLPEIQNGWKTTSHTALVRGARITYQCDPGYDIVGSDTLTCQWDLTWSSDPPFCEKIMYCTDPGEVEHSTRLISDPVLLVGTTIQYTCNPGFVLEGSSLLTCYSRETGTPIWTSRLPHCISEESLACDNPGLPENGYQILYKRLYLPGETLTFMCYEGFELMGEVTIKCILGQPSHWSGPLPICKVNQDSFEHALEVAEAAAETSLEGGNMALAIFIPVLILLLLLGGAYVYITRCRYYSNLRLPLMYSHPYSQITVETEFDNPIYETGETREYEVSI
ncbi:seizure 6-like protein [Carettochelys insculpta]|uniref:seizure 6-like protein n=1 Tax=Carettochelys insculpta TaxID=44489 RepID=UPI003EC110E8